MAAQVQYRVILKIPSSGDTWELFPKSYSYDEELNREPTASFQFSFEELKAVFKLANTTVMDVFAGALREISIERMNTSGTWVKIFYGVVSELVTRPTAEGETNLDVNAIGWLGLFKKRIVGVPKTVYTGQDASDIAWDLIDDSQNSDSPYSDSWAITRGADPTTVNRDRTYRFDNILEAIQKLSNLNLENGFDFDINSSKQFNVFYPTKGSSKLNITFDTQTMANWSYDKPLVLAMANKVHVMGEGSNDDVAYATRNASNSYKTPFGLLEDVLNETDVKTTTVLEDKGDRYLEDNRESPFVFNAEHYDSNDLISTLDYDIGDTITVNVPEVNLAAVAMRVKGKHFRMDEEKSVGYVRTDLE